MPVSLTAALQFLPVAHKPQDPVQEPEPEPDEHAPVEEPERPDPPAPRKPPDRFLAVGTDRANYPSGRRQGDVPEGAKKPWFRGRRD